MKNKISKKEACNYEIDGYVLGSKILNCCGHLDVKIVAIDFNRNSVLINGCSSGNNCPKISEIKKRDCTYDIVYLKEAKDGEYNLWLSIDSIERYKKDNKKCEVEEEVTEDVEEIKEDDEEDEYDAYEEFKRKFFAKEILNGDIFRMKIKTSSSIITSDARRDSEDIEKYAVYVVKTDEVNLPDIINEMLSAEEKDLLMSKLLQHEFSNETYYEIIYGMYLDDLIYAMERCIVGNCSEEFIILKRIGE